MGQGYLTMDSHTIKCMDMFHWITKFMEYMQTKGLHKFASR